MNSEYLTIDCKAIEFIDATDVFASISDLVEDEILVDYSSGIPVLKIGKLEYNEGDIVVKLPYSIAKVEKKSIIAQVCDNAIYPDDETPFAPIE